MYIHRELENEILDKLTNSNKGIVIYGARQVGKTSLVNHLITKLGLKTLIISGDQSKYMEIITSRDLDKLTRLVAGYQLLFIDEAQRISEIGINLKIILDNLPDLKVIVTGSAALDLASKISEPLTGRIWTYKLYPLSFFEMAKVQTYAELSSAMERRLIFGSYPEIFSYKSDHEVEEYLKEICDNYLYKDLLDFSGIKNSPKIREILKLLAFQIGSEVSFAEIANTLDIAKDTVSRYVDLLEKSFIIFRINGFSRNLRKEVTRKPKIYFYDLGIRNVFVNNFNLPDSRNDLGALWENFLIVERMKTLSHKHDASGTYFWRTHTGAEIDYLEERDGKLAGFEFKWKKNLRQANPSWKLHYPTASFEVINRENYWDFIVTE